MVSTTPTEDEMTAERHARARAELLEILSELPHVDVTVCVPHKRFVPCRSITRDCYHSSDPTDVEKVRSYQSGESDD